eukprot:3611488-Rhodomonas_salina.2
MASHMHAAARHGSAGHISKIAVVSIWPRTVPFALATLRYLSSGHRTAHTSSPAARYAMPVPDIIANA